MLSMAMSKLPATFLRSFQVFCFRQIFKKMNKVKILVLGPAKSGKTVIANHLAEATETSDRQYHPTQGCRILEFQVPEVKVSGKKATAEVELWDCSGDHKFESCWPAMARDASGVIFVYNPDQLSHDTELESWYNYCVRQHGLRDTQCILFEHQKSKDAEQRLSLSGPLGKLHSVTTSAEDDDDVAQIRNHFTSYLGKLFVVLTEKREEEEMTILNSR